MRAETLSSLDQTEFDLCIIGGGASGCGAALDAASRGLKTILIEKNDFASETSSRSTKLLHGGVRYLEQAFKNLDFAQLKQVKHGLAERATLLNIAPHLAKPLALHTPVFSFWEGLYYKTGLFIYDLIAGGRGHLPSSDWLSKVETKQLFPLLSAKTTGAIRYYDGQFDDARFCLALALTAEAAGATVLNHVEMEHFYFKNHTICAAQMLDTRTQTTFDIRAKKFLNCTGAHSDFIRQLANPDLPPRIQPSKGVHVVLRGDAIGSDQALLIPKTKDGRLVFVLPFENGILMGTTDTPWTGKATEPILEKKELDFLLETLVPYLKNPITAADVRAGFGGIRPLIKAVSAKNTKNLLRDHEVETDPTSGLISLLGGKWTTYRVMASDAINAIAPDRSCTTADIPLVGAAGWSLDYWKTIQVRSGLDADICQSLSHKYGTNAPKILDIIQERPELARRLSADHPHLEAEVLYACRHEKAGSIRDFLARRIRLEFTDWAAAREAAPAVGQLMAEALGWTEEQKIEEVARYQKLISNFEKIAFNSHSE